MATNGRVATVRRGQTDRQALRRGGRIPEPLDDRRAARRLGQQCAAAGGFGVHRRPACGSARRAAWGSDSLARGRFVVAEGAVQRGPPDAERFGDLGHRVVSLLAHDARERDLLRGEPLWPAVDFRRRPHQMSEAECTPFCDSAESPEVTQPKSRPSAPAIRAKEGRRRHARDARAIRRPGLVTDRSLPSARMRGCMGRA